MQPIGSIKVHRQALVRRLDNGCAGASDDVSLLLSNMLHFPLDGSLVRSTCPIANGGLQRLDSIGFVSTCIFRRMRADVLCESSDSLAAISRPDCCRSIAALLKAYVAPSLAVASRNLEFGPCCREVFAALDPAFESRGKADPLGLASLEIDFGIWMVEVRASRTIAIPVVVVEGIALFFARFVCEHNTRSLDCCHIERGLRIMSWENGKNCQRTILILICEDANIKTIEFLRGLWFIFREEGRHRLYPNQLYSAQG